jgi:hypothetical protein
MDRTYKVPIISQLFLDTICRRCQNHHGYVLRNDTMIIVCGADERTRLQQYHLDLITKVATNQSTKDKINIPEYAINSIRAIQRRLPRFELSVERCDAHCVLSGCARGGEIECKVVKHNTKDSICLKVYDPPDRLNKKLYKECGEVHCHGCKGAGVIQVCDSDDEDGDCFQQCPCSW